METVKYLTCIISQHDLKLRTSSFFTVCECQVGERCNVANQWGAQLLQVWPQPCRLIHLIIFTVVKIKTTFSRKSSWIALFLKCFALKHIILCKVAGTVGSSANKNPCGVCSLWTINLSILSVDVPWWLDNFFIKGKKKKTTGDEWLWNTFDCELL